MARPTTQLDGALALVTGAGSGIGRATALALAREGCRVLCADIDAAAAEKTAAGCAEVGPGGAGLGVDVADRAAMLALAEQVRADHGAPDVLVNNAGVGMTGRFLDTTLTDWDWIVGINLMGVVHGCHAFGPGMVERGSGHVVNVSSGLAYAATPTEPAYVTTKAGVLALSRSLRADWHGRGVGVSAVCPGVINTPIIDRTRFRGERARPEQVDRVKKLFRRGHPPEAVARAVLDAVRRNRSMVPVGAEASFGWLMHRLAPTALTDRVFRSGVLGR